MAGWGGGQATDKVCLEDCVFRSILDLSATAGRIRSNTGADYQKNADNYYYQVINLWALVSDYMDENAYAAREKIIKSAQEQCIMLTKGRSFVQKDKVDEVVNITFQSGNEIFEVICKCLSKKGLLREQSAGAIAGSGATEDIADEELNEDLDELNAPDVNSEEDVVA